MSLYDWPSDLDPTFREWMVAQGIQPIAWNTYGEGFQENVKKQYATGGSKTKESAPEQHSQKTGRRWPDNVSLAMQTWLTRNGVTIDQWYDKGESFRSDLRARYQKTGDTQGAFRFSSSDLDTLRQAGWTQSQIDTAERKINDQTDPQARKDAYHQQLLNAQTQAAQDTGRIGSSDVDASGRPIRVLQQHNQLKGEILENQQGGTYGPTYTRSITAVLNDPFAWNPDQIKALQDKLVAVGALDAGSFISGKYDAATIDAYRGITESSVKSNMTPADYLRQLPANALKAKAKAPFVAPAEQRMDEKDIERVAMAAAQQVLGRDLTPQELSKVTAQVRQGEDTQYAGALSQAKAEYGNVPSAGGQQVTSPPDVQSLVQSDFATSTEGKGYRVAQLGLKLLNFMQSGGGAK